MNRVDHKKLLLSKWTAVQPQAREKHFLVAKLVLPDELDGKLLEVELEAVHSGVSRRMAWRELKNSSVWRQGWV
jgi:tryptophan-rich hypothetical protein